MIALNHHEPDTHAHCLQLWRPLVWPVQDSPLGLIDASTVAKEDLVEYAIHFPDRTGCNYGVQNNPEHK